MKNEDCNKAIQRCFNNINVNEIEKFIDSIEYISNIRKDFYKKLIKERYNIIKYVYNTLTNK